MSVVFSATRKVTDTVTLCKDNPAYDMALHLDRFQLEGVEYIRRACYTSGPVRVMQELWTGAA